MLLKRAPVLTSKKNSKMKYHVNNLIHLTHLAICISVSLCLCFGGCTSKRNVVRTEKGQSYTEQIETSSDTSRTEETVIDSSKTTVDETVEEYIKTTEYDSTGIVRRVSEEWRERKRNNVSTLHRQEQYVFVNESEKEVVTIDSTTVQTQEAIKTTTDSRPVQGVEWIWIVLSVALVLIVLSYIIYNKLT